MADVERLIVALEARTKAFENALNRANGIADKRARSIETRFAKMAKTLNSSVSSLATKFGVAIGGALSVKSINDFLDSFTKIQNSLKVAGLSGAELTSVYDKLYASAQRNAAPIESLATLYGRVAINQKELGVSSEQVVGLTDTVAKALKAQGSTAEESSGALLQLAQALGSGKIQAEEYNSLIDGMPVLLQAAAAGIQQAGGSVNKLTQLVKSGQLSNKAFFDGIAAGSGIIDQKLANASETSSQSLTKLNNALTNAVGRFGTAANASASFGNVVDRIVRYLDTVNFDHLAQEVAKIVEILNTATTAITGFLSKANEVSGIDVSKIATSIVPRDGESTSDYLYRSLYGTSRADDKARDVAKERLAIEQKIADLRNSDLKNSPLVKRDLALYQAQLDAMKVGNPFVQPQRPISRTPVIKRPVQGPNKPAFVADPIDITDDKYKPTGSSSSKSKKARLDEYDREVKSVTERTAALSAQTAAQAALNPYVNDYGLNVEKAATAQDLLSAAQAAGTAAGKELKDVNQLLSGNFDDLTPKAREQAEAMVLLATKSGEAVAASERLQESQQRLRQNMEEWRDLSKDATKGFISDLLEGKSAVDALAGALQKLGDKLLNDALDGIFGLSGSNNWFSSLFSGMATGGVVKAATGGRISGPGTGTSDSIPAKLSDGEYVVNAKATKQNLALLDAINSGKVARLAAGGRVSAPTMPNLRAPAAVGNSSVAIDARTTIQASGNAETDAEMRRWAARRDAELPATVIRVVKDAQKRRLI